MLEATRRTLLPSRAARARGGGHWVRGGRTDPITRLEPLPRALFMQNNFHIREQRRTLGYKHGIRKIERYNL